jgi:hypothetical protein
MATLRAGGEILIQDFPSSDASERAPGADRELALANGKWIVRKLA